MTIRVCRLPIRADTGCFVGNGSFVSLSSPPLLVIDGAMRAKVSRGNCSMGW